MSATLIWRFISISVVCWLWILTFFFAFFPSPRELSNEFLSFCLLLKSNDFCWMQISPEYLNIPNNRNWICVELKLIQLCFEAMFLLPIKFKEIFESLIQWKYLEYSFHHHIFFFCYCMSLIANLIPLNPRAIICCFFSYSSKCKVHW